MMPGPVVTGGAEARRAEKSPQTDQGQELVDPGRGQKEKNQISHGAHQVSGRRRLKPRREPLKVRE